MCNNLTQVSQTYEDRAVFRCEHNTFHLAWDKSVFHLSMDELRYLYSLIEFTNWKPFKQPNIHLFQRMTPEGMPFFELWIQTSGLRLSFKDISILKKLLSDSFDFLEREHAPRQPIALKTLPAFPTFSWN